MNKKTKPKGKKGIRVIFPILLVLMVLPYVLPLSSSAPIQHTPFENSSFEEIGGFSFHRRLFKSKQFSPKGKIMLVHGLGGSTYSFESSASLLAEEGYHVLLVDLPGFGYSDRKVGYDHAQANRAKDLWRLLNMVDKEFPEELAKLPWHLGGHSMGGGTVAAMAMQQKAASLILIDGALFNKDNVGAYLARIPFLRRWFELTLEHLWISEKRVASVLGSAYGTTPNQEQVEGYYRPLLLPGTARVLMDFVGTSKSEDPEKLKELELPIFALWGKRDTILPLDQLTKLQEIRPDVDVHMIEDAGHCPMETHTKEVVDALLQWLSQH